MGFRLVGKFRLASAPRFVTLFLFFDLICGHGLAQTSPGLDMQTSPGLDIANVADPAYFSYQEAMAASNEGDYTKAIDGFKEVLALSPTYPSAWNELGRINLRQGRLDSAAAAFRKQIQINASDPLAYNNLGLTLERQEKWEEAIQDFQKQIQINSEDRNAHANLGYLFEKRRDYDHAIPELQRAISISPKNASLLVALANAYCQSAQEEKCRSVLNDAAGIADTPLNWNNVAWSMAVREFKLDEALKYAQRAVAATATSLGGVSLDHITNQDLQHVSALATYWDTLGWVYFQRNELPTAERYLVAAWQLRHDGVTGNHVGQVYEKLGRKDDAVRYYSLSLVTANPEPGTRERLIALSDAVSDERLAQYRTELDELSIVKVPGPPVITASADFYVELTAGTKAPDGKFICGDESLKSTIELLRHPLYEVSFPDSQPVNVIRRVEMACTAQDGTCRLKLLSPSVAVRESADAQRTLELLGDTMGVDFSSYNLALINTVRANWFKLVPQEVVAPQMKKGKVWIGFAIKRNGTLDRINISKSSGDIELDHAAFDAILRSAPFPTLPLGFTRSSVGFRFRFFYNPGSDSCANDSVPVSHNSVTDSVPAVIGGKPVYKVGGNVTAPQVTHSPQPKYSKEARKAKYEGTCVLWLIVGPDGRPQDTKVTRAVGLGLDEKAIEAVKKWKFKPATKDGKPVAVQINVEVSFRLY